MYAIAVIRYRRATEEVLRHNEAHRAYLAGLKSEGTLVASGPLEPRYGGALLLRVRDDDADAALDAVRDGDPYVREGVAQYEILKWRVGIGRDDLDRI